MFFFLIYKFTEPDTPSNTVTYLCPTIRRLGTRLQLCNNKTFARDEILFLINIFYMSR